VPWLCSSLKAGADQRDPDPPEREEDTHYPGALPSHAGIILSAIQLLWDLGCKLWDNILCSIKTHTDKQTGGFESSKQGKSKSDDTILIIMATMYICEFWTPCSKSTISNPMFDYHNVEHC